MKRLILLEWRELSTDFRSWLIALLPLLLFSASRFLALTSGESPLGNGLELFHFGLPAMMVQMTLLADLLAHQRVRGELELLWLLPLTPARLLAAKLLALLLPTLALLSVQLTSALFLLHHLQHPVAAAELLWPLAALLTLTIAFGAIGARLSLSGGSVRRSVARIFLLLFLLIIAVEFSSLLSPLYRWSSLALLLLLSVAQFRILVRRWNLPQTRLGE